MKGHATMWVLALVVVLGLGFTVYVLGAPTNTQAIVIKTTSQSLQNTPGNGGYDCSQPAINSQNFCDQLPAGFQIAPRLPNGPGAYCRAGMSDSACALLKQTFANGVCDPNETVWTDPLDCGCTGALVGDPFTGRCGAPATVCQLQAQQQAQKAAGNG